MALHSSILAWKVPWEEESGGPHPPGHRESDMNRQMNTTTTVSNSSQYCKLEEIIISYMETHVFWSLCLKTSLSGVRARNRPKGITTIKITKINWFLVYIKYHINHVAEIILLKY